MGARKQEWKLKLLGERARELDFDKNSSFSRFLSHSLELHPSHKNNSTHCCRKWPSLGMFFGGLVLIVLVLVLGINMNNPIKFC